jgi:hypothetical protein
VTGPAGHATRIQLPGDTDRSAEELLRVLADPDRLAVAGSIAAGPLTAAELRGMLGLPERRLRSHLAKLAAAGIIAVEPDRRTYRLVPETLRRAAQEAGPTRDPGLALGAVLQDEEAVLRHYFRGGRLREIPSRKAKRRIILSRLALEFEPGVRYPEREVNATLKQFHDDHASLRRYLVDEGYLTRDRAEYWRSGGPVDV